MVGLSNVDNTTDLNKPISTLTQTALNLKSPLANPTFTGTVSGIDKTMVGLSNVDNTTDLNKPISTLTQTALNLKAPLANPIFTGTISGNTNFSVDATGNLTAYSITSNNNLTCTDLKYSGGTSLSTKIGTLQPRLTNLNNTNNVFNSANALMTNFTPSDQPTWTVTGAGSSVVNNSETITDAWGDYN